MIGSLLGYKLGGVCARDGARNTASVRVSKREREREVVMIGSLLGYGVATISRLLKIIGFFCKRSLEKRLFCKRDL